MNNSRENQWNGILSELKLRITNARNSVYLVGFIVMLLSIGALGIWVPPFRFDEIKYFNSESLFTYSGPILAMLLVEYFVQAEKSKLAVLALIAGLISLILISIGYMLEPNNPSWSTIIGTVLTLILIILVNANDKKFDDSPTKEDLYSPTGHSSTDIDNIKDK